MKTLGQRLREEAEELVPGLGEAPPMPSWAREELARVRDPDMRQALERLWGLTPRTREWLDSMGCATWEEYERRRREDELFQALVRAGVPDRYAVASFEGSRVTEAIQAVRRLLLRPGACLVLCGPTGVGKTWAAACYARALAEQGRSFVWVYAVELFARISPASVGSSEYGCAPVLIVDDLGAEEGSGVRAKMDALIYARHGKMATTLITTNLTLGKIRDRYGDRVADRLAEWGEVVTISGESFRGR